MAVTFKQYWSNSARREPKKTPDFKKAWSDFVGAYSDDPSNHNGYKTKLGENIGDFLGFESGNPMDITSGVAGLFNNAMSTARPMISGDLTDTSNAGQALNAFSKFTDMLPGTGGAILSGIAKLGAGLSDLAGGHRFNEVTLGKAENNVKELGSFSSNVGSVGELSGVAANRPTTYRFTSSDLGKQGWDSTAIDDRRDELQYDQRLGENNVMGQLHNNMTNIGMNEQRNYLSGLRAEGGHLGLIRNGSTWNTGLTFINNGGTHEENPNEGVPFGQDAQGVPNLVEEGEVIWNDYVFSNRLKVPKDVIKKYKLKGSKDMTFADAVKKAQKESEERPNDPIAKRGLEALLTSLQEEQEVVRQVKEEQDRQAQLQQAADMFGVTPEDMEAAIQQQAMQEQTAQQQASQEVTPEDMAMMQQMQGAPQMAHGGRLGNLFDGLGPINNWMQNNFNQLTQGINSRKLVPSPIYREPLRLSQATYDLDNVDFTQVSFPHKVQKPSPFNPFYKSKLEVDLDEPKKTYSESETDDETTNDSNELPTWMRYAPIAGSWQQYFLDLMGATNVPDYSNAERVENAVKRARDVKSGIIGNRMQYIPINRDYYLTQDLALENARRNALINTAGGNRAVVRANLIGDSIARAKNRAELISKLEEQATNRRNVVEKFNAGIDEKNIVNALVASQANQNADNAYNQLYQAAIQKGADIRGKEDSAKSAARSANRDNFYTNLGNLGKENATMNMVRDSHPLGYMFTNNFGIEYNNAIKQAFDQDMGEEAMKKRFKLTDDEYADYHDKWLNDLKKKNKSSRGGYITIKNRRK